MHKRLQKDSPSKKYDIPLGGNEAEGPYCCFFHSVLIAVGVDVCAESFSLQNDWRDDDLDGGQLRRCRALVDLDFA